MKVYDGILQTVGKTPLVKLNNLKAKFEYGANVIAKVEFFNPAGSVKDRIAKAMIEEAEKQGLINKDTVLVEPTSGNTGIGLSMVAASKGLRIILTMPETMSQERRSLLKAYGATLVLTPGAEGMPGAIRRAEQLHEEIPGSVILGQFTNPANPDMHFRTTGEEIWRDTEGNVDVFVAGVGTGGTVSGVGKSLKMHKSDIRIVAVEPATSPVLSTGKAGKHRIQGIGAGFVPQTYDSSVIDSVLPVSDEDAVLASRLLAEKAGLLVGISSGAAFSAAYQLAKNVEYKGKTIVALLPDTGERYLSTILYDFENYPEK